MISTSCSGIAEEVLNGCLSGKPPKTLPPALLQDPCGKALFRTLAEGLADRFEPSLCDAYARLFSQAVAHAIEGLDAAGLVARYERIRRPRPVQGKPHRIFVLSRITLGADVAVTSVMLSAAKRRFPHSEVVFVGPRKNYELFAADPHIHHIDIDYRRGGLRDRLSVWERLKELVAPAGSLVVDPDSRLTQLGLLPICSEERHHLFESRAYGAASDRALPELAAAWAAETFAVRTVRPYVALGQTLERAPYVAVSLGVGENAAKRLPEPFEEDLLRLLAGTGLPLCVDRGAGGEEADRVSRAIERSGAPATVWDGSFAGFARIIAGARLYVGYDSAGQHVAAACGVPLVSIFAGFPCVRMFERWRPTGERCTVIRSDTRDPVEVLERVKAAVANLAADERR